MWSPALLLLVLGQPTPPKPMQIDPTLPEDLRPLAEKVIAAEIDPKRGTGNAVEILKAERTKYTDQRHQLAIDLRTAAVVLRRRFITVDRFPEPIRWEQALSTFARLDLSEPGLKEWIDASLKHHDYAKKRIGTKKQRVIKAAILTRAGLDKDRIAKPLSKMIADAGFQLSLVPAKDATMIIKISAEDAPPEDNLRMVRMQLGLESIRDGKVIWRQGMYRTEGGRDADEAIDKAALWLAKIGGRDLFFRWVGEVAFHSLLDTAPKAPKEEQGGFKPRGQPVESDLKVDLKKK